MPLLPSALTSSLTCGQATVVPNAIALFQAGSWADRKLVNRNVSPELSDRRIGTIFVLGSVTPGLILAMASSSQLVMVPW